MCGYGLHPLLIKIAFLWNIFTWLIFGVVRLLFCSIKIIM